MSQTMYDVLLNLKHIEPYTTQDFMRDLLAINDVGPVGDMILTRAIRYLNGWEVECPGWSTRIFDDGEVGKKED